MEDLLSQIEWVPVLVSFAVAFVLGFLWYSPLMFAKGWQKGIGIAPDDQSPMWKAMLAQMAGTFWMALLINVISVGAAVLVAFALGTLIKANGFFSQKSIYSIAVEAGYILVMVSSMVLVNYLL